MTTSPTVLRLATRLEQVGFSDIVKLRNRIMELRSQGATVYQFEGGEPFMPTPAPVKAAMKHALDQDQTRYAPSSGIPELREAIADKLRSRNRIPKGVAHPFYRERIGSARSDTADREDSTLLNGVQPAAIGYVTSSTDRRAIIKREVSWHN